MGEQVRERKPKERLNHPLLERLEAKRRELGLSQERFAVERLGIAFNTYQRWLYQRFNPTLEMIERIERVISEDGGKADRPE
jgi:transcriptional regulator with XRE-family HTH domain